MIQQVLQEIGLTQNEIKVYTALLDIGESKTGEILNKSGLNSGRIYEILDSLQKKGLVSHIIKSGIKYFSPADPKRVLDYLEQKKQTIEKQEQDYNKILPDILKKISDIKPKAQIEVFVGFKGLKTSWQKEFNYPTTETVYIMGVAASTKYSKKIRNYFANIHRPKRFAMGYKIKKLLALEAKKERKAHEKEAEIRFISSSSLVAMGMVGSLTIITIATEDPISITIESQEVADYFKNQFNILWESAEK